MAPLNTCLLMLELSLAAVSPEPGAATPIDHWSVEIAHASARFGVPADWIRRVMRVESNGALQMNERPIVSSAGAMGLMQLMPGTWSDMRSMLGLGPDPHDPRDNILAGAAYLRLMYDRFGYPGLFAAYNAGPRRYAASLSGLRPLPSETRSYLAKVAGVDFGVARGPSRRAAITYPPGGSAKKDPFAGRGESLFVELTAPSRE